MNAVLERKLAEKGDQVRFVNEMLSRVASDGTRDLVEAEQKNLEAAKQRIRELDEQIEPLREFEAINATHDAFLQPVRPAPAQMGGNRDGVVYATAGSFMVDVLRARGYMTDARGGRAPADPEAEARVRYALQNQTTGDTPGLLPHSIVGQVVNLIDASRPFITSIGGGRAMGGIPGKTFGRPKVTQHTTVGPQTAEKTELPTQKMVIGEIAFTKATYGGAVDVSRQDIDWTSPAAWNILISDLADIYAQVTEAAAAADFVAKADDINAATVVAGDTLKDWSTAMYAAAGLVYAGSKRLPDRMWISTDVWGSLGPVIDTACCSNGSPGDSSVTSFAGNLYQVPRIVVPSFPAGTAIVGWSGAYEVYEEVIGLLTAVEPSLLGVEVAYGGYIAFNAIAPEGLAILTAPAGPITAAAPTSGSGSK
jgi:HK97 family phage major capsid protein